ncbi:LytTR family DNA-binding domain-containing protein [Megasphaera paucivorans]|uniref:Two component transcriptional regulator, LytTR family n=1 Tax=Megasphaera paucivorans TaxID=349095 RepID=A0A1H0C5N4_9FIRM|nr:LytTR family DNA-binding domain-containing protein [Megasphaera paucivorans]SDN53194.1 two component transcriptional regulator, LytTR family [Megasphaera paucivorans]
MDSVQIAVCDNESKDKDMVVRCLQQYLQEKGRQAGVRVYDNGFDLLEELNKRYFDIILLDILMPGISGIEVAEVIGKMYSQAKIIFLTSSRDYAIEAFSVQAVHYLIKPFQETDFNEAMDRAFCEMKRKEKQISVKLGGGVVTKIDIEEIDYIENYAHEQNLYLKRGKKLLARQSLSFFLESLQPLAPGQFVQPCKGYLVNMKAIRIVQQDGIVLLSGVKIPISRNNFRSIRDAYFDFGFASDT